MASLPAAWRSRRAPWRSFDAREPFLPQVIQLHCGNHITKAILGDFAETTLFQQAPHVHAGDSMAFRRFDAERFAIKVQIEPARRAITSAHAVKSQLLRQVAMRFSRVTIAQPILAR